MRHTIHVLRVLLMQLTQFPNVVGVELLNEPAGSNPDKLKKWYSEAIMALRQIDPEVPLYLGECWQTEDFTSYVESSGFPSIILDHHLYRCFTQEDHEVLAYDHAGRLWDHNGSTLQTLTRVSQKLEACGGALIIGEWSGALNPRSLEGLDNQDHARSQFIRAQVDLYEKCCAGYFFWTYKKQEGGDKGWSFRDAVEGGVFPRDIGLRVQRPVGEWGARMGAARDRALGGCFVGLLERC